MSKYVCDYWINSKSVKATTESVSDLVGKTLKEITVNDNKRVIKFITEEGDVYYMFHEQDCCECVEIEDIVGDLQCLIGSPILLAEERTNEGSPKRWGEEEYECDDSATWTFYTFATIKGYVDIRWYGSSNGYYSESVDFVKEVKEEK